MPETILSNTLDLRAGEEAMATGFEVEGGKGRTRKSGRSSFWKLDRVHGIRACG